MENDNEERKCFCCSATFDTDQEFWKHIYEVDCSKSAPTSEEQCLTPTVAIVKTDSTDQSLWICGLCDLQCLTSDEISTHNASSAHRAKVTEAAQLYSTSVNNQRIVTAIEDELFCEDCQVRLPSIAARQLHIAGKKHQKRLNQLAQLGWHQQVEQSDSPDSAIQPQIPFVEHAPTTSNGIGLPRSVGHARTTTSGIKSSTTCSGDAITDPTEFTQNPVSGSCQPPGDNYAQLNVLLRRLCLTQILYLIHRLDEKPSMDRGSSTSNGGMIPSAKSVTGVDDEVLLEMMRGVCREELHKVLPAHFFAEAYD